MELVCIVAASRNGVIGNKNQLPWQLKDDLQRFKEITMGYPLIMGRKNHQSIGRALPGRPNLVISRQDHFSVAQDAILCPSLESALHWCILGEFPRAFLIGGGQLYQEGLDYCDRLILTEVQAELEGDVFFNWNPQDWSEIRRTDFSADQRNEYPVIMRELERILP